MSDVQGTASLDNAQVIAGLRQMKTAIDQITGGMTKLNNESERTKRTLRDTFKDSAQVAGKAGGPVGSFTGKLLGGASMDGAFGRIAAGIGVLTYGLRSYQSVVDAAIERTRLFVEAQKDVRNVAEQADKALEGMARKGESQAKSRMDLVAVGGQNAAQDADMVASTGAASPEDAAKGVAAIYGRFGDTVRAKNAVDIAMRGAMGGLNYADVAQELTRHGGAIDDPAMADRMLGRMAMRQTGARGNPEDIWKSRMGNINADAFLMEARQQAAARSVVPGLERDAFMTANLGRKDAAFATDPKATLESESYKKFTQAIEDLKKLAEAQGWAAGKLADIFQPGGSFETQQRRMEQAFAESRGVAPPKADYSIDPSRSFPTGPFIPQAYGR